MLMTTQLQDLPEDKEFKRSLEADTNLVLKIKNDAQTDAVDEFHPKIIAESSLSQRRMLNI